MSDNPEAQERIAKLAFDWAHAAYLKGCGKPFPDIDAIRAELRAALAALAQQAATPSGDLTVPPPMPEPDGWRYWHKTDSLKLAVVSKRMDPSLAKVLARDAEWAGRVAAARQAATPAPAEPVAIDYDALIAYCSKKYRWAQGTPRCSAFAKGAEWMRDQIAAPPATPAAQPADEREARVVPWYGRPMPRADFLRAALGEIADSKSLTATPTQFYQHLQRIACRALTADAKAEQSEPAGEREAFEAWAVAHQFDTHRDESEKYRDYHRATTRWAWLAWQARAALEGQG